MKNLENKNGITADKGTNWIRIIGIILLVGTITLIIVLLSNFYLIVGIYDGIFDYLNKYIAINIWLMKSLTTILTTFFIVYVTRWIWLILSPLPTNRKKRVKAIWLLCISLVVLFMMIFLFTNNDNFNKEGANIKCYAATPNGFEYVDCSYKKHPKYGTEVMPLTEEAIALIEKNQNSNAKRIVPDSSTIFFLPNKTTYIFYYKYPDGKLEFFQHLHIHPQFGENLYPVTNDIVKTLFDYLGNERDTMIVGKDKKKINSGFLKYILNNNIKNNASGKEIIINIIDSNDINHEISNIYKSKGYITYSSFFSSEFKTDGIFDRLFEGNSTLIKDMKLFKYADFMCLGKLKTSFRRNSTVKDMICADISIEIIVFSLKNGNIINRVNKSETGTGWSNNDALSESIKRLISQINLVL